MYYFAISIAVVVIAFLFCIFLVIFAPKSQNFFNGVNADLENLVHDTNILDETFVAFGIELNNDALAEKYKKYKTAEAHKYELKWVRWPDANIVSGNVEMLPLKLFDVEYPDNIQIFETLYQYITEKDIPIKSIYFVKLDPQTKFKKHNGWSEVANDTLKYIYCFNSFCYSEDECGIWVNGESKKLFAEYQYVIDSSKEHSIYNYTFDAVVLLVVEFDRPEEVLSGISSYPMPESTKKMYGIL